jgi:spore germination cell wall hydrolase CwlJ-like protein
MERLIKPGVLFLGLLLAIFMVQTVTAQKIYNLKHNTVMYSKDIVTIKDRERQLDCLAKNIYYEAGGESFEGKVAVAQVTMNRMESGNFPNDVCGVVYQKTVIMERVICQFSWYCTNAGLHKNIRSSEHYDESYAVAKKVLLEGFRLDILKDAMFYHADYVNPNWGKEKIGKIGRHIFYRGK